MSVVERRRTPRHRTLKGGSIAFSSGARIDCRVRNMSPLGACLELETTIGVPDKFVLLTDSEHTRHSCRVAWREPQRLGVEFIGELTKSERAREGAAVE